MRAKAFAEDPFRRYTGQEVTKELFEKIGMREPVIINDPEGLDMSMPPSTTTVRQIAQSIGERQADLSKSITLSNFFL